MPNLKCYIAPTAAALASRFDNPSLAFSITLILTVSIPEAYTKGEDSHTPPNYAAVKNASTIMFVISIREKTPGDEYAPFFHI
jgi:hypothetical protein